MKKYYKTPRRLTMKAIKYIWETILMIASIIWYVPSYLKPETYSKNKKEIIKDVVKEYYEKQKLDEEIEKQAIF